MSPDQVTTSPQRPSPFPWPPLLLAGVIALATLLGRWAPLDWPGVNDTPAQVVGYGFGVAGLALALWAALTLWWAGTTIRPDRASRHLVTWGAYRWGRNPIYAGEAMILLGLAQATLNIWYAGAAIVFLLLVRAMAVLPEEHALEAQFGDAYRDYVARTRRWI